MLNSMNIICACTIFQVLSDLQFKSELSKKRNPSEDGIETPQWGGKRTDRKGRGRRGVGRTCCGEEIDLAAVRWMRSGGGFVGGGGGTVRRLNPSEVGGGFR